MRASLRFPNPVNETSARLVAAGVVAQLAVMFAVRQWWLLIPLVYGFAARVAAGPRLSPLGLVVTRVVTPRLPGPHRFVPGPPKRFAQSIGLLFSSAAAVLWALGARPVALAVLAALGVAAGLEAFAGICLGCVVFQRLMRWGVIPERVCVECADLSRRWARAS